MRHLSEHLKYYGEWSDGYSEENGRFKKKIKKVKKFKLKEKPDKKKKP